MSQEPEYLEAERIPPKHEPPERPPRDPRRFRTALMVALAADAIQLAALPAFAPGILSPVADLLDVVVAIAMVGLLGWHWAFLPTFLVELVPFVDLVPTWTLAVIIVGRARKG